jgi:hypothetical protein
MALYEEFVDFPEFAELYRYNVSLCEVYHDNLYNIREIYIEINSKTLIESDYEPYYLDYEFKLQSCYDFVFYKCEMLKDVLYNANIQYYVQLSNYLKKLKQGQYDDNYYEIICDKYKGDNYRLYMIRENYIIGYIFYVNSLKQQVLSIWEKNHKKLVHKFDLQKYTIDQNTLMSTHKLCSDIIFNIVLYLIPFTSDKKSYNDNIKYMNMVISNICTHETEKFVKTMWYQSYR